MWLVANTQDTAPYMVTSNNFYVQFSFLFQVSLSMRFLNNFNVSLHKFKLCNFKSFNIFNFNA